MSLPALGLLGAAIGLDATSFAQVMLSRPIVAGTLAGLMLGRPADGLVVGAVLEVFHLGVLPIGAARYPEAGTATVAATAGFIAAGATGGALLAAVVFGLAWGHVAGLSVDRFRRLVERILFAGGGTADARALERRHLGALAVDGLRGAAICLLGIAVGTPAIVRATAAMALNADAARALTAVAASAVLASTLGLFGTWREQRAPFLIGAGAGALLLLVT
jgi:mannose/fructose/N-acetylgalactosamine-specific phosphotransferase system component IIC